jgi:hypothetical protein
LDERAQALLVQTRALPQAIAEFWDISAHPLSFLLLANLCLPEERLLSLLLFLSGNLCSSLLANRALLISAIVNIYHPLLYTP